MATKENVPASRGERRRAVNARLCVFVLLAVALWAPHAQAHEMRPAYLQIRETTPGVFDVLWKVPARGVGQRLSLNLRFDDDVEISTRPVSAFANTAAARPNFVGRLSSDSFRKLR